MAQMDKRILKTIEKLDPASLSKLLSSGVSTQGVDKKGNTFLHLAAISNSIELCGILIAGGCDPLSRNKNAMTAADVAEKKKKKKAATYLREQELKFATNMKATTTLSQPLTPSQQTISDSKSTGDTPNPYPNHKSVAATVNIFCYDYNLQDWQQVLSEATLLIEFIPNPFGYYLIATSSDGAQTTISDLIGAETIFSKSTDSFYNYRLGEGEVYGFQFIDNLDEFCTALNDAKNYMENPPAPIVQAPVVEVEQPIESVAPVAVPVDLSVETSSAPPVPPAGDGPPPPPPPPPPPAPVAAAKGLSLAEQLALKKQKLTEAGDAPPAGSSGGVPASTPAGTSSSSSGGGMMSELQLRLQKRQSGPQPKLDHSQQTEASAPAQPAVVPELKKTISSGFAKSTNPVKSAANPLKTSAAPPVAKKVASHNPEQSASVDESHARYTKQDLEAFKQAMIEGFKAELQQIKEDLIHSIRQEISSIAN